VYLGDVQRTQSHQIPDDGDRDSYQNVGFFEPFDMAYGLKGY